MKRVGKITLTFLLVIAVAIISVWTYSKYFDKPDVVTISENQPIKYTALAAQGESTLPDLTFAAENSVHAVVYITTESVRQSNYSSGNPFLDQFFGLRGNQQPQVLRASGSGVILSDDGYIVTNNHVIEDAQNITVVLNDKREYDARLIGTDPSTDIALLKIDASGLPYMTYGNSDDLRLGEWVLAVGNPFRLTSTVTAGIISARARNLGINQGDLSIESFIQTDAAVNPGNSGGALVNQRGELVGINSAIASQTGSYAGYSFAVPVTIVKKVVDDLKEYGEVQRALLGVQIQDVNAETAEDLNLDAVEGVRVTGVTESGAAREAGIRDDDVIISVNGTKVNTSAELQEKISQYRPGDDVNIVLLRDGERKQFTITLRNTHGDTQIVRDRNSYLGAEFEEVSEREKENLDIDNGIKIVDLEDGQLKDAGVKEDFIITSVNKTPVYEVNDLRRIVENARGGILVEGIYPNKELAYFVFGRD